MADTNSIFYKLGLAVKEQVASGAFNTANSAFTGTTTAENLTISGNLQVLGEQTVTKINQTDLDISDNFIGLNRGASTAENNTKDIGFYFERGNKQDAASFVFDEDDGKFVMGFLAAGAAGGVQINSTTSDGSLATSLSGDLADSISAAIAEGPLQVAATIDTVGDQTFAGLAPINTRIEFFVSHPDITSATEGPWMDGHNSAAEFISSLDALDFSTGGAMNIVVAQGSSPWDSEHIVEVYINDGTNEYEVTSSTVKSVTEYATELSVSEATVTNSVGSPAATADATNVSANAAPLKVASLEINDATDGALSLGDFADFEAALAYVAPSA
jgi:hypothetical protein